MPRILWFKEVTRWNRRAIPLKVVWVSPRQLSILFFSFLVGLAFSAPFPTPVIKLISVGSFLSLGVALSFWPTRMLTPEQLIMVRLQGLTRISQLGEKGAGNARAGHVIEKPEEEAFQIEADSTESFTPLSISGRWRRTKLPRKVSLYIDGVPRAGAEALATPVSDTESGYTIIFFPTAADVGTHDLEVKVEGEEKPIYEVKVDVKVKGMRSLEMRKIS